MKTLIPGMHEKDNPWMYCNYARVMQYSNPCVRCEIEKCKHKGKTTSRK